MRGDGGQWWSKSRKTQGIVVVAGGAAPSAITGVIVSENAKTSVGLNEESVTYRQIQRKQRKPLIIFASLLCNYMIRVA